MDHYERSKMADAVKEHKFNAGDVIIKQGEEGDQFYILVDGEAEATLDSNKDKPVMHYKQGQYFGELALLRGDVRAANVTATTNCKCIGLDRKSFKRLLGPLDDILKRNIANYQNFV
jgi:cAMP-dependent protein kinase regulator